MVPCISLFATQTRRPKCEFQHPHCVAGGGGWSFLTSLAKEKSDSEFSERPCVSGEWSKSDKTGQLMSSCGLYTHVQQASMAVHTP